MSRISKAGLVLNSGSGPSPGKWPAIAVRELFRFYGVDLEIEEVRPDRGPRDLAKSLLSGNPDAVIAAGGDGTVRGVASAMVDTGCPMGVFPIGTLNHFARDVGIPADPSAVARAIAAGATKCIDAGEVNGEIFVNNSSLGLYPRIVSEREKKQHSGVPKWPAAAWAALRAFGRRPFVHVTLEAEGRNLEVRTPLVFIGNNDYETGGFRVGRRARLDQGHLCTFVGHHRGRFGLLRMAVAVVFGRIDESKDFDVLRSASLDVASRRRRIRVALDGEVLEMNTPLHYRIRPGALHVISADGVTQHPSRKNAAAENGAREGSDSR